MADSIVAPYLTPNDLNQAPNPELGGLGVDLSNKNPFGILGNTVEQLNSEDAANQAAKQQRVFQNQQAINRYKNDALARASEYAHQDALTEHLQHNQDIRNIYNATQAGQINPYRMPDGKGGFTSFTPPAGHQDALKAAADELNHDTINSPLGLEDPNVQKKFTAFQQMSANSGAAAMALAQLKQKLAQTSDPAEQKNIQNSIDQINATPPTQLIDGHLPVVKETDPLPSLKDEYGNDNKKMQSFTINGEDMLGRPTVDYNKIKYALQGSKEYELALNGVDALLRKGDPILTDPTAFTNFVNLAKDNWENKRGQKDHPLNLGYVDANGKVVLGNPMDIATAMHLTNDGSFWQDPDAQSKLDDEEQKATIREKNAQAAKANRGDRPTTEQIKDQQYQTEAKQAEDVTRKLFSEATSKKPIGWPFAASVSEKLGVNPKNVSIYPPVKAVVGTPFVGVQEEGETTVLGDANNKTTTKTVTGNSVTPDYVYPVRDNATGEVKLYNLKGNKVISINNETEATKNYLKHQAKYDPKIYENRTAWVGQSGTPATPSAQVQSKPAATPTNFTPKIGGQPAEVRNNNGVIEAKVGTEWKKVTAKDSKTGELTTE